MARTLIVAALLALALPLGVAGAPVGSGAAGGAPSLHEVAVLTLGDDTRAGFDTASMDVATAVAVQREAAEARIDRYALEAELDQLSSTDARKARLFEAATEVEITIAGLRDDDRQLRAAYAAREIEVGTFVRGMARLDARAGELRSTLDVIQREADEVPEFSLRGRVRLLDASLIGFEGPVRERALEALRGESPATRVYVQASADGAVLATIEDGRYVREAYRADHRDIDTVRSISLNQAAQRTSELYPVAYNSTVSIRTGINGLSGGLFRIDIELQEGLVTAYLDGATSDVFFEVQERRLDLLGPRPGVVARANGTQLLVNRSYPGGPLEVAVTANATGEPRSTTVFVDGHPVETGADGTAWTLTPSKVSFEVTAVGPEGNVTVSVRPFAPARVDAEG
ncbi:MAG: hypothetical protein U5J98_09935 [Halobacteriales archaeon]|nr:hypothetical protein [Halobacteriales archaeon]